MGAPGKEELARAVERSAEELHRRIEMHRTLIKAVLENVEDDGILPRLVLPSASAEARLRQALGEAIEVLEQTRKAFKSKKLEALRKRLTNVLIES